MCSSQNPLNRFIFLPSGLFSYLIFLICESLSAASLAFSRRSSRSCCMAACSSGVAAFFSALLRIPRKSFRETVGSLFTFVFISTPLTLTTPPPSSASASLFFFNSALRSFSASFSACFFSRRSFSAFRSAILRAAFCSLAALARSFSAMLRASAASFLSRLRISFSFFRNSFSLAFVFSASILRLWASRISPTSSSSVCLSASECCSAAGSCKGISGRAGAVPGGCVALTVTDGGTGAAATRSAPARFIASIRCFTS